MHQESISILGISLEKFLCLTSSLLAEVGHEEVCHLPAVALFFSHDTSSSVAVVIGWCGCEKVALLFNRCEFCVALNGDHGDESVTHALVRNLE